MEVVNLVCGDRRSPEQSESYVGKSPLLCGASGPVLALHHAVVRCGAAECDPVALIVGAGAGEGTAPRHPTLEMVDVRRFEVRSGRLVMATILVEPGDRIGISSAVGCARLLRRLLRKRSRADRKSHPSECPGFQKCPSVADVPERFCGSHS
jgi:hypothetical protein